MVASWRQRLKNLGCAALVRGQLHRALHRYLGPERLTVLMYHRINHPDAALDPNALSATPESFARHIDLVTRFFNVISLDQLHTFIIEGTPLPPHALLITFDDGYQDNYTYALPVLEARGLPAVIFLVTDAIGRAELPWWDVCAHGFHHTTKPRTDLPLLGERALDTPARRAKACRDMTNRLKRVPEAELRRAISALPEALGVPPPAPDPHLFMTWDQVRDAVARGFACQAHTITHPILANLAPDEVARQIAGAGAHITAETDKPSVALAFPNGSVRDYDHVALEALRHAEYTMAFTTTPAVMRFSQVRQHPLEIARISIELLDSQDTFIMKLFGLERIQRLASPWLTGDDLVSSSDYLAPAT